MSLIRAVELRAVVNRVVDSLRVQEYKFNV